MSDARIDPVIRIIQASYLLFVNCYRPGGSPSLTVTNGMGLYRAVRHVLIRLSYFTSTLIMTNALFSWLP